MSFFQYMLSGSGSRSPLQIASYPPFYTGFLPPPNVPTSMCRFRFIILILVPSASPQRQEIRGPDIVKVLFKRFKRCQCVLIFPKQEVRGPDIAKVLFNRFKRFQCVLIFPKQEVRGTSIAKVLFNHFKRFQCMLISPKQEVREHGVAMVLF